MLKYTQELYAKFGRKYIPTGKTGADWDALERNNIELREAANTLREYLESPACIVNGFDIPDKIWEPFTNALNKN